MPNTLRAKCIIVGESASGKTAITQVFISDGTNYPKAYNMTLGAQLNVKTVNIPDSSDSVELYLYDLSGKDVYNDILPKFWTQPSVIMAVYDVTSENSFMKVKPWVDLVRQAVPDVAMPAVILANKTDLKDQRTVSPKAGKTLAQELGMLYLECSAKENQGVEEPFFYLANEWHKLYQEQTTSFKMLSG